MIMNFDFVNTLRFDNPVVLHVHFSLNNSLHGQQNNLYEVSHPASHNIRQERHQM